MSWLNDRIDSHLRTLRQVPSMAPVIDQVKAAAQRNFKNFLLYTGTPR